MQTYTGSCHCGAVGYEVDMELQGGLACNCSHCGKKGLLLAFVPMSQFRLLKGDETLTEYRFNKKVIAHRFCSICGVQPFANAKDPQGVDTVALNLRTVDGIDLDAIPLQKYNGKDI
jgi:hypothetical protein